MESARREESPLKIRQYGLPHGDVNAYPARPMTTAPHFPTSATSPSVAPYRPWQIDAGRPGLIQMTGGLDRSRKWRARNKCSIPWISRRERGITIKAQTVRLNLSRQGRQGLHLQPDGHAGPCRLRLRSLALRWRPARDRCWWSTPARASRRRRSPNVYHALDAGFMRSLPILNKIDLPAAEPEKVKAADRGRDRHQRLRRRDDLGQDRPRRSRTCWKPSSPGCRRRRAIARRTLKALPGR